MSQFHYLHSKLMLISTGFLHCYILHVFKDDRQRFLWKVSKKQFRTVYYNANVWVVQIDE